MGKKYHFKNVSETKIVISMPLSFSLDCETITHKKVLKRDSHFRGNKDCFTVAVFMNY